MKQGDTVLVEATVVGVFENHVSCDIHSQKNKHRIGVDKNLVRPKPLYEHNESVEVMLLNSKIVVKYIGPVPGNPGQHIVYHDGCYVYFSREIKKIEKKVSVELPRSLVDSVKRYIDSVAQVPMDKDKYNDLMRLCMAIAEQCKE